MRISVPVATSFAASLPFGAALSRHQEANPASPKPQHTAAMPSDALFGAAQPRFDSHLFARDENANGLFDLPDIAQVGYDPERFADYIATRPEKIILMGEDHKARPTETIEQLIRTLAQRDQEPIYAIELPESYLSVDGVNLVQELNDKKISAKTFKQKFVDGNKARHGANYLLTSTPAEIADHILKIRKAGAKSVHLLDEGVSAIIPFALHHRVNPGYVTGVNRDEIMAEGATALLKKFPKSRLVFLVGSSHAQSRATQRDLVLTDEQNPLGTRLIKAVGRENVLTVNNYKGGSDGKQIIDPLLTGEEEPAPFDTWDYYIPAQ
jgi:hypothetical protein